MTRSLPTDWRSTREGVLERDGDSCLICNSGAAEAPLEVHHIVPRSKGGSHNPRNLATVCRGCHLSIHSDETATDCQHETTVDHIVESVESYHWQAGNVHLPATVERVGRVVGGLLPTPRGITTNLSVRRGVPDVTPRRFTDFVGDVLSHGTGSPAKC